MQGIFNRDYPVVQGAILVVSAISCSPTSWSTSCTPRSTRGSGTTDEARASCAPPTRSETSQSPGAGGPVAGLRFIAQDKKALVGLIVLGTPAAAAILAPWIAPYDPNEMAFDMIGAPSWAHLLGTDDPAAICSRA